MNYTELFILAAKTIDKFKKKGIKISPDEAYLIARNEYEISEARDNKQLNIFGGETKELKN